MHLCSGQAMCSYNEAIEVETCRREIQQRCELASIQLYYSELTIKRDQKRWALSAPLYIS
jgi:hypothetical protein